MTGAAAVVVAAGPVVEAVCTVGVAVAPVAVVVRDAGPSSLGKYSPGLNCTVAFWV